MKRETELSRAFVDLAGALVGEGDILDFLYLLSDRTAAVLPVDAAGVLLAGDDGRLQLSAATDETGRLLKLFELHYQDGACIDAFTQRRQVIAEDLAAEVKRWPAFAPAALDAGVVAVCAVPMRMRGHCIGSLAITREHAGPFAGEDVDTAQALADVATVGVLQERRLDEAEARARQLQHALDSRVLIEQTKGALAERLGVNPERAFDLLRRYCRRNGISLREACRQAIHGELTPPVA
jgi:GAF domain-containing protein